MNIQDVKTVCKALIETKTPITPMLWARHGIGKSSSIQQLAKELGYQIFSIILSQKEAVDVGGVLYTYTDESLAMSVTGAHPPAWFAAALKKGKVVLFLDEINMARKEVSNAAFELILDRRLNNMKLPDDVFIVCAGNPDDERYDVVPMSESMRDRLMHLKVTPDVDAWLAWARSKDSGIHPDVARFIEQDPKAAYLHDSKDEAFPVEIKHSFRSWERVGLIHALPISTALKTECMRGVVGPELAVAFMRSFGSKDVPLDALEILELSPATKSKIAAFCDSNNMRVDLLSVSVDNLVRFARKNHAVATKRLDNVKAFIKLLPEDIAQLAISQLCDLQGWSDEFLADAELRALINSISAATALPAAAAK